jgi:hypothetical protein
MDNVKEDYWKQESFLYNVADELVTNLEQYWDLLDHPDASDFYAFWQTNIDRLEQRFDALNEDLAEEKDEDQRKMLREDYERFKQQVEREGDKEWLVLLIRENPKKTFFTFKGATLAQCEWPHMLYQYHKAERKRPDYVCCDQTEIEYV